MENEQILTVLTEILEDQKDATRLLIALKSTVDQLEVRLDKQEESLNSKKAKELTGHYLQELISKELVDVKTSIELLPKKIGLEKRILLFPEHNAKEYYSVIFRWLLYIIMATYSYWIIKNAFAIIEK